MLKVINPKDRHYYQSRIDLFMGMLHYFQEVPLTTAEQEISTFIIGEGNPSPSPEDTDHKNIHLEDEIYGGAILYKRSAQDLPPAIRSLMADPQHENVWETTTCLFSTPDKTPVASNSLDGAQAFYKELREKFIEFGEQAKIHFLYFSLCPFEYQRTRNKGFWPYSLEISPEDSPDGLFHGILSLSKNPTTRNGQPQKKKIFSSHSAAA